MPSLPLWALRAKTISDAPDLGAGRSPDPRAGLDVQTSTKPVADEPPFAPSGASRKGKVIRPPRIVLAADQLEALRDRLVAGLSDLKSADEAADWVHKNLPAKNTLAAADAEIVEASFRERLGTLEVGHVSATAANASAAAANASAIPSDEPNPVQGQAFNVYEGAAAQPTIVRRCRATAKTIRLRDKEHCKFVATHPCVVCGRTPAEAHKVSDEYTVPVCRVHHRELHRYGDEASWWAGANIDPLPLPSSYGDARGR
jgi:hypothetical protein